MKAIFLIPFLSLFVLYLTLGASNERSFVKSRSENPEYLLVFEDEFDGDLPDPTSWTFERGFTRNKELQWYQKDNVYCQDGILIIEGRRERIPNPNYKPHSNDWREHREFAAYTSSSINTRDLHSWQYGRFEIKAKIDISAGMWPAIWMLGVAGEWPSNGEIDIMEYYSGLILANFAWGTARRFAPKWDDMKIPFESFPEGWENEFHVWRMDWTDEKIEIYLDDQLINEVDLSDTANPTGPIENPFKQPHYLLMNLAIGGHGGDPSNTEFPIKYEIDYVRVYQQKK